MTSNALAALRLSAPHAAALAGLASIAARIDRVVLRTLRIELLSEADATAEADLWFSGVVARRTPHEIVLHADVLDELRQWLVASTKLPAASALVRAAHQGAPPLLVLEEDLIGLGVGAATEAEIERRLGEALATLREHEDRAMDVAGWALTALPRMPERVRKTAAAWSLAFAAESRSGYAVVLGHQSPAGAMVLDPATPSAPLLVARHGQRLVFGANEGARLSVPATTPRVLFVEDGDTRVAVTVEPGKPTGVDMRGDSVVLEDLRGARWLVRSASARRRDPPALRPETGRWILVDGLEVREGLPHREERLARTLGEELARAGFSLLTLGRPGVAHAAASAFWEVLAGQGYSSGIYRMAHVVGDDEKPDYAEAGRVLQMSGDEPVVNAAIARADAVLTVGSSSRDAEVMASAEQAARPFAALLGDSYASPLVPRLPEAWTDEATRQFAADVVDKLAGSYAEDDAHEVPAPLLHLAATVLDRRGLDEYRSALGSLRSHAEKELPPGAVERLVTDPRRPSHRLLGYCAPATPTAGTLARSLVEEVLTIRLRRDTRPLQLVLESLPRVSWGAQGDHGGHEGDLHALAASIALVRIELDASPRADPDGDCRGFLAEVTPHNWRMDRANALGERAREYEHIRSSMPSGPERTNAMTALVDGTARTFDGWSGEEPGRWLAAARPGARIVALALVLGRPNAAAFAVVEEAIRRPLSAFEQYTALRAASLLLPDLPADRRRALLATIEEQRSGPPGIITPEDPTRWTLSGELLDVHRDYLEEARQAVAKHEQYRRVAGDDNLPELATSLLDYANLLENSQRFAEALDARTRAVEAYGELVDRQPLNYAFELASSAKDLGASLDELGRRDEATEALHGAVSRLNANAALEDDPESALTIQREGVGLQRQLVERDADRFRNEVEDSLKEYASRLSKVGRETELRDIEREIDRLGRARAPE